MMTISNSMVIPAWESVLADMGPGTLALLPGDLDGDGDADLVRDGDADLPGNLPGVLDGTLVALPLSVSVALGSAGVSMDTS